MGVPMRLERVVENLLDNAISFSPPDGSVDLVVANDANCVTLTVCDQGPGIPPQERQKIFRRFHSVRPDAEAFGNHSGLGLAIGQTIAEAHDGSLSVTDRADGVRGACLVLALPEARTGSAALS